MEHPVGIPNIRKTMQPLERLDLRKRRTVSDIVDGMSRCSFGARMLGEAAATWTAWARRGHVPTVIYDGRRDSVLGRTLLPLMKERRMSGEIMTSDEFVNRGPVGKTTAVIGIMTPRNERPVAERSGRTLYINLVGQTKSGQVHDGFFPDVVFSDPEFIVPILFRVLEERLGGRCSTVLDLQSDLEHFEGEAKTAARAIDTLHGMVTDRGRKNFLTLSGAMTVAKMGLLIDDLIDFGWFHCVHSTGALMAHGLIEGIGLKHYKHDPEYPDALLAAQALNRVTDTLEPEENFDHIENVLREVLARPPYDQPTRMTCPSKFHHEIGRYLAERYPNERAILKTAFLKKVPVCVPAFTDSEIGNDLFVERLRRLDQNRPPIVMDLEQDSGLLLDLAVAAERIGVFSIGGGVPRNNVQNVACKIELINARLGKRLPPQKFDMALRIDPTPLWYGNLSGCTYSEGGSWRKFDLSGTLSEVRLDATIAWPFIQRAVMERVGLFI